MFQKPALFISYIFHPLFIPTYLMLVLFNSDSYISYSLAPSIQKLILVTVFVMTAAMPVLSSLLIYKRGIIKSMTMEEQQERAFPFLFASVYFFVCFYFLRKLPVPAFINYIILGAAISIVLAFIINFFWKISIHMIGAGGFTGTIYALSFLIYGKFTFLLVLAFILSGLTGSARMQAGSHTNAQLYAGFLLGFFCQYFLLNYFIG